MFAHALDSRATLEFAEDVRRHLSKTPQRELHSKYLYDDVGSALFEVITLLPSTASLAPTSGYYVCIPPRS